MTLVLAKLKSSPGLPGASGADYPATRLACAQAWADAMGQYAAAIVPASTTVAAAAATLATALNTAFSAPAAAAGMETAFAAFATTVGSGMAPAFTGTPPPAPVGFAAIFAMTPPSTRQDGVDRVADAIDLWIKTGVATPSGPGSPVNWS